MSDTIWVQVRGQADDQPWDCSIMLKLSGRLDRLARQLKVTLPSEFHDHSSLAAEYADEFDVPEDALAEKWTEAAVGLASVSAILEHLNSRPDALGFTPKRGQEHWPELLFEELGHAADVLGAAVAAGQPFRFLIVM